MATMNFSIPDDVRDRFNETFAGKNKSAIVAQLMVRAIEEEERDRKSLSFVERLRRIRERSRRAYTDEDIRKIRDELRE